MATDYNGWANWATWNVALHFDNDEGLYREYRRYVSRTPKSRANVEAFVKELLPNGTDDMDSAKEYRSVDWDEIADAWWEDEEE